MSVLLLILKILGIVLLAVLGLILLVLLSVLFVPVRYRIRGSAEPEAAAVASVRWMYPLVSYRAWYAGQELEHRLRILGIPVFPKKEKERPRKKAREGPEGSLAAAEAAPEPEAAERPMGQPKATESPGGQEGQPKAAESPGGQEGQPKAAESPGGQEGQPKAAGKLGRGARPAKKRDFVGKARGLRRMIQEKMATLKKTARRVGVELRDESNRNVLRLVIQELRILLRHYQPRRIQADVRFGMADPSLTGQLLGLLSMMPAAYQPGVRVEPDFMAEKMYVTGFLTLKGRVRAAHLVVSAIRLWRKRDVKKLWKKVRNRRKR